MLAVRLTPCGPRLAAYFAGRLLELDAQVAHRLVNLRAHVARELAHRLRQVSLEREQRGGAPLELCVARICQPIDLPAADHFLLEGTIALKLGQPRVDRARRRRVEAEEAVFEQADDV